MGNGGSLMLSDHLVTTIPVAYTVSLDVSLRTNCIHAYVECNGPMVVFLRHIYSNKKWPFAKDPDLDSRAFPHYLFAWYTVDL